jgi:hypothetical protein
MGEGDRDHRILDYRAQRPPSATYLIPVTSDGGKSRLLEFHSKGRTTMKRLLILAALGLFLAAHGAVGLMSTYSQPAELFDDSGVSRGGIAEHSGEVQ